MTKIKGICFKNKPLLKINIYRSGIKKVTFCKIQLAFSMGVAKPESKTEGSINTKVPSMACCWVLQREEMKIPIPLMAVTNKKRLKKKRKIEPVKGTCKRKVAIIHIKIP